MPRAWADVKLDYGKRIADYAQLELMYDTLHQCWRRESAKREK